MTAPTLSEGELRALISLLSDDDAEVHGHVRARLLGLGEQVIPYLESEWMDTAHPEAQRRLEDLIHTLQFEQLERRLVAWGKGGGEDLLEGMWIVATYQYPDLDLARLRGQIDQLYYEAWLEMRQDLHPFDTIAVLNRVLFKQHRFSANRKNFHSPANSMINQVLELKRGNPISLCVVYLLICQRMNLPIYGVNMPNLFILTYKGQEGLQFYINAFNGGVIFKRGDIDNYLEQLNLPRRPLFYEPCSHVDIVLRVLRNLATSFERTRDEDRVEEVSGLIELLVPFATPETQPGALPPGTARHQDPEGDDEDADERDTSDSRD